MLGRLRRRSAAALARAGLYLDYYRASRRSRIYLCGGMPRSGSTWLYNAVRLIVAQETADPGEAVGGGWIADWKSIPKTKRIVLKVHDFDPVLVRFAHRVVYSYRDLRDAVASSERMFKIPPSVELARRYVAHDRRWRRHAGYVMRYEAMKADPIGCLRDLARVVADPARGDRLDLGAIAATLSPPPAGPPDAGGRYDGVTLFHPSHVTDGRVRSWVGQLPEPLVREIEAAFAGWFRQNDYPLSADAAETGRSVGG